MIAGLGASKKKALVVLVPSLSAGSGPSSSESSVSISKVPDPARKLRWIKLNEILEQNRRKQKGKGSTAYSYVSWESVKSVLKTTNFDQPQRDLDDKRLDSLLEHLTQTAKCFGGVTAGKEAQRMLFIAPIITSVCVMFDDIEVLVQEDLVGNFLKAHGRFEFMLRRNEDVFCIVEAKKENIQQGMAQDLIGCEVAAEIRNLPVVYGIVTNYIQWNFLRSLNDKVELDEYSLEAKHGVPDRESLKVLTGKIYGMLSKF